MINEASSAGNDFALDTYTVSGQVTYAGSGYAGGATIDLTGAGSGTVTTDGSGDYSFTNLLNGFYTVTPSLSGQTLSPTSASRAIAGTSSAGNDFILDEYTISGSVTRNGSGFTGVTMDLTGDQIGSDTTDDLGDYFFTVLNGGYTVTPMLSGQVVSPASSTFTVSFSDISSVDFSTSYTVWLVNGAGTATTQDGLSWGTAFRHPQNGADVAAPGDEVWVAQGFYFADTTDPTAIVLIMPDNVEFHGGFAGTETSVEEANWFVNTTTLDGWNFNHQIVLAGNNSLLQGFVIASAYGTIDTGQAPINAGSVTNFRLYDSEVSTNWTPRSQQTGSSGLNITDGEVKSVIFKENDGRNGSIYVVRGSTGNVVINNALFHGNSAQYGGALVLAGDGNNITINNTTIADNFSSTGGAIYFDMGPFSQDETTGNVFITNSIVMDGLNGPGGFSSATISYSNIEGFGASPAAFIIDTDPLFLDAPSDNYKMDSNSPGVDAGNNADVPPSLTVDIIGGSRIVDGDGDTTATVDMGAYEFPGIP